MCVGAFAEWVPCSPVADVDPPLWTQCLYRLVSRPINLSFPVHILLFNVSHDFNKGFFLGTPMHVNNMLCNSASYRSITKVLFPILFGSLSISFLYAGPLSVLPSAIQTRFFPPGLSPEATPLPLLSLRRGLAPVDSTDAILGGGSLVRHPRPKRNGRFLMTWY